MRRCRFFFAKLQSTGDELPEWAETRLSVDSFPRPTILREKSEVKISQQHLADIRSVLSSYDSLTSRLFEKLHSNNIECEQLTRLATDLSQRHKQLFPYDENLPVDDDSVVVSSDEVLNQALSSLRVGITLTLILTSSVQVLANPAVIPDSARVCIHGRNNSLRGAFKLGAGSVLEVRDTIIKAPNDKIPCIAGTGAEARVLIDRCHLSGGRDGVYLSAAASCDVKRSTVTENRRGIFEGFRCLCTLSACELSSNQFHLVLLGNQDRGRIERIHRENTLEVPDKSKRDSHGQPLVRGQICFRYNPVMDSYDDVFNCGKPVVLSEAEKTTCLVEPSW